MREVLHDRDKSLPARISEAIGRKPNTRLVPVEEPLQARLYDAQSRLIRLHENLLAAGITSEDEVTWLDTLADDLGAIVSGWQTAGQDHSRRVPRPEPYEFEPEHAYEAGDPKIEGMRRVGAWD